jgi:phage portal protein BeeE
MADWWRRLFYPEQFYGDDDTVGELLSPGARQRVELLTTLETADPWNLPTAVAARELVADTAAMMPMFVEDSAGVRLDPTPSVVARPDPAKPYRDTIERIVNGLTRHGRAWLRVDAVGSNGWPLAVAVVADPRVHATVDIDGRITDVTIDGHPVDRRRIVHIPMVTDDDPLGASPLLEARFVLEQLAAVYAYSAGYYTTGQVPPYAVIHPNRLTRERAEALSDQWLLARAERRPPVLSGGIELATYSQASAADALLMEAQEYLDALIARLLLIPPSLLNVTSQSSLTYSTVPAEFQRWLTIGLQPMFLSRIEAAFTDMLPRGQRARFDPSELLALNVTAAQAAPTAIESEALT